MSSDLWTAWRRIVRGRGVAVAIIGLLALAMTVLAGLFSVAHGLLWKPLPYPAESRLVQLTARSASMGIDLGWSVPYLAAVARYGREFDTVAGYRREEMAETDAAGGFVAALDVLHAEPALLSLLAVAGVAWANTRIEISPDFQPPSWQDFQSLGIIDGELFALHDDEMAAIIFWRAPEDIPSGYDLLGPFDLASLETPPLRDVQTTLVPPGGATMVEFKVDYPGKYILVDHALSRLEKGNVGFLTVTGNKDDSVFKTDQAMDPKSGH